MYRPKWFPKDDILTIALNVHMFSTGTYDTSLEDHEFNMKVLKYALKHWKISRNKPFDNAPFDDAVKNIITIAIKEGSSIPWI